MTRGTVTVLGATGKTGRAVAVAALGAGWSVRGTTRDPGSAPPQDGMRWVGSDLATGQGLAEAFTGADAAYLVMPNVHPGETEAMARAARLAREAGVTRIVYHSVADPDDARMVHHLRKGAAERAVREVARDAVVLQPCAYQQNLLGAALAGRIAVPYRLDAPFSLVALQDVARAAVVALGEAVPAGSTHVLAGPEELTVTELAERATEVLGRPVGAEQTDPDRWRAEVGDRLPDREAEELAAMFAAYDQGGFTADPAPLTALLGLLGRRPTTWAEQLRDAAGR